MVKLDGNPEDVKSDHKPTNDKPDCKSDGNPADDKPDVKSDYKSADSHNPADRVAWG